MNLNVKFKLILIVFYLSSVTLAVCFKEPPKKSTNRSAIKMTVKVDGRNILVENSMMTLLYCQRKGPPPWKYGNQLTISLDDETYPRRCLINMTAENFFALFRHLKLKFIEVERLGEYGCIITDPRIPRDWFNESPTGRLRGMDQSDMNEFLMKYEDYFSTKPEYKVMRPDPDFLITKLKYKSQESLQSK